MNEKELRRLSRAELVELLLELSRENSTLRAQLEEAQAALQDRTLRMEEAGTMAEAAMKLTGVFEAADAACRLYMENYRRLARRMVNAAPRPSPEEEANEEENP